MDKMIGICGMTCTECPAYLATQKDDDKERARVAEMWSKEFNENLKPEDINCSGCLSEEKPLFGYSAVCEIRKCGRGRGVENCAYCDDYACEKLNKFFETAPDAKNALEEIRKSL